MNQEQLFQQLEAGALLLCVNQRLGRYWLAHYETWQSQQGRGAWPTPHIQALEHWVQQQYRIHAFEQAVLSLQQEKLIWQQIIDQDMGVSLLDSRSMATRAQEAYALLHAYQLSWDDVSEDSHEVSCFKRWMQCFEQQLLAQASMVTAQVKQKLCQAIAQQDYRLTVPVIWAGFDDFNPINQALLTAMQQQTQVELYQATPRHSQPEVWQCYDEDSELRRVCARIRQLYPQKQHIAVLVPDMQRRKQAISKLFHAELSPSSVLLLDDNEATFNLSLGSPLMRQPMIRFIFLLLRCCHQQNIQFEHVSALLLSPYLFPLERPQRAKLEQWLRHENMESFSLKYWLHWPKFSQLAASSHAAFVQVQALDIAKQQLASAWVDYLNQVLTIFQIEHSFQLACEKAQWRNWLQVCDDVSGLDDRLGRMPFLNFLQVLQQHCVEQAFRPDPSQSSIQVMGMLEASGMNFEHVFIVGMHENVWPSQAKPHPLLPLALQRQQHMPHADAQREYDYANQVWQNILASSEHIEVSYAMVSDGQETRASCLLQAMPVHQEQNSQNLQWQQQLFQVPARMQPVQACTLPPHPQEKIGGGSGVLHAQARCAFKAFAHFRLKVQALEKKPHAGFSPMQRGNLLHEVLNHFWSQIEGWDQLKQLQEKQQLQTQLTTSIAHVLQQQARLHPLHQNFEHKRLRYILEKWLLLELEREPFKVIAREKVYAVHLPLPATQAQNHFSLQVKIDRMDEDAQGNLILLDYKTGRVDLKSITSEPLREPQLPLYLQVEALQQVGAVSFAQIRTADTGPCFVGVSRCDDILPGVKTAHATWDNQLQQWRNAVHQLTADFFQGKTLAKPYQKQDCEQCNMQRLCRV